MNEEMSKTVWVGMSKTVWVGAVEDDGDDDGDFFSAPLSRIYAIQTSGETSYIIHENEAVYEVVAKTICFGTADIIVSIGVLMGQGCTYEKATEIATTGLAKDGNTKQFPGVRYVET